MLLYGMFFDVPASKDRGNIILPVSLCRLSVQNLRQKLNTSLLLKNYPSHKIHGGV